MAAIGLAVFVGPVGLTFNKTASLPLGLYVSHDMIEGKPLVRGQIACFPYEPPDWARGRYMYPGELLCKKVLGLPGDVISTKNGRNKICHDEVCDDVGAVLSTDSKGRPALHPEWSNHTIPSENFYLGSTRRPTSFDSRYLGLVPKNKIVKTLVPLLVEQEQ